MLFAEVPDSIHLIEVYAVSILGMLGSVMIAATLVVIAARRLVERLDDIWEFIRMRGRTKAANRGMILNADKPGIPDALRADLREAYEPFASTLRALRAEFPTLSNPQFIAKINKRMGEWLTKYICGPHKVDSGECLEMARIVAMEPPRAPRPDSDPITTEPA